VRTAVGIGIVPEKDHRDTEEMMTSTGMTSTGMTNTGMTNTEMTNIVMTKIATENVVDITMMTHTAKMMLVVFIC
jgi:hypothetical protein